MSRPLLEVARKDRRLVVGKLVRVVAAPLGGGFVALVRQAGATTLVVQRPGGDWSARTVSARCRGARLRVAWSAVQGVIDRRRGPGRQLVPLREFLERARSGA